MINRRRLLSQLRPHEAPNLPSFKIGIILGVNGRRVHDIREYHLVINTRPHQNDSLRFNVLRDGNLVEIVYENPLANSNITPLRLSRGTIAGFPIREPAHPLAALFSQSHPDADLDTQISLNLIPKRLALSAPDDKPDWLIPLVRNYVALCAYDLSSYQEVTVDESHQEWFWFDLVLDAAHKDLSAKKWQQTGLLHRQGTPLVYGLGLSIPL